MSEYERIRANESVTKWVIQTCNELGMKWIKESVNDWVSEWINWTQVNKRQEMNEQVIMNEPESMS